jgi:hypothetical protein
MYVYIHLFDEFGGAPIGDAIVAKFDFTGVSLDNFREVNMDDAKDGRWKLLEAAEAFIFGAVDTNILVKFCRAAGFSLLFPALSTWCIAADSFHCPWDVPEFLRACEKLYTRSGIICIMCVYRNWPNRAEVDRSLIVAHNGATFWPYLRPWSMASIISSAVLVKRSFHALARSSVHSEPMACLYVSMSVCVRVCVCVCVYVHSEPMACLFGHECVCVCALICYKQYLPYLL